MSNADRMTTSRVCPFPPLFCPACRCWRRLASLPAAQSVLPPMFLVEYRVYQPAVHRWRRPGASSVACTSHECLAADDGIACRLNGRRQAHRLVPSSPDLLPPSADFAPFASNQRARHSPTCLLPAPCPAVPPWLSPHLHIPPSNRRRCHLPGLGLPACLLMLRLAIIYPHSFLFRWVGIGCMINHAPRK
jgi:hypothetical protein